MMLKKFLKNLSKDSWGALFIIAIGSLSFILTMVKSGLCLDLYCQNGKAFWGPNGHDGIWHIALSEAFSRSSWEMPVFSGSSIQNYHIGFDLLLSIVHKLTNIPTLTLYFQILPVVFAVLLGYFANKLLLKVTKSKEERFWALFFLYFGGSFGWIVTFLRGGAFGGESMFWAQQAVSTLVNPPFALSLVMMFLGFWLLEKALAVNDKRLLTFAAVVFGLLIQVKAYASVLALFALFVAALWDAVKMRRLVIFKVFLTSLIVSILILPSSPKDSSIFIFKPFWFLETMMQLSDRFGWQKFGEAMVNYKSGGNILKATLSYSLAFVIFVVGNFGTRIFALFYTSLKLKNLTNLKIFEVSFFTIIILGVAIPMFFVQEGTPWNTIQFLYYSQVFLGIFSGFVIGGFLRKVRVVLAKSLTIFIVVALTAPTTIGTLMYVYLPTRAPSYIPKEELEALHFLASQPPGVVLTYPIDRQKAKEAEKSPPRPLYLYESTAYVSALSKHDVYLEDEVNLDITGYDWKKRREEVINWLKEDNPASAREFLATRSINYIYWVKGKSGEDSQRAILGDLQLGLTNIYENEGAVIYKTN